MHHFKVVFDGRAQRQLVSWKSTQSLLNMTLPLLYRMAFHAFLKPSKASCLFFFFFFCLFCFVLFFIMRRRINSPVGGICSSKSTDNFKLIVLWITSLKGNSWWKLDLVYFSFLTYFTGIVEFLNVKLIGGQPVNFATVKLFSWNGNSFDVIVVTTNQCNI